MTELTCFKAYDVRGELGVSMNASIAYRIGRAVAQHFQARSVIVGRDARETSQELAEAMGCGVKDAGGDVMDIGLAGTEEMYWAVTAFSACAGIEVTASHNPINYNGVKIVKSGSRPLDDVNDFKVIKQLAETENWIDVKASGLSYEMSGKAREKYTQKVLSFIDVALLKPLKIVINSGNGAAGPTFDAISKKLKLEGAPLEFVRVHHKPDHSFPNGIPNPLLPQNHEATKNVVINEGADMGIAFDGDFDRCFFFDASGKFVPGEYIVGLIAAIFLHKENGATIVHDPRVIWNTQDIVSEKGGFLVQSKTGHAFIKQTMRIHEAVYGGEMSAHHYFRDFAYCDSGMIPWLMIAELISTSNKALGEWINDRIEKFPSSGEQNYSVVDSDRAISSVVAKYQDKGEFDNTDGVSFTFSDWRFNLRKSNTEQLVRLNAESRGSDVDILRKTTEIKNILLKE